MLGRPLPDSITYHDPCQTARRGGVQAIARAAELRYKVFKIKMDQVEQTGAKIMVPSCSNCRLTMDESKAHWKWEGNLASLVEIVADRLIDETPGSAGGGAVERP